MDFGKFDFVILITMSIAVVSLSFTLPALGMTDAGTGESDIPELDISSDRFDMAGDFPTRPGGPSQYHHEANLDVTMGDRQIPIDSGNGHVSTFLQFSSNNSSAWVTVEVSHPDMALETADLREVGDRARITNSTSSGDVDVEFELTELEYDNLDDPDNATARGVTEITVNAEPEQSGFIDRVPVIGGVVNAGGNVAAFLGWIGSVIMWGFVWIFELSLNLIGMLFDAMVFGFSIVAWLTVTYGDVVSSSNSWASVFVAIPGLALFLELFKLTLLGVSLLPTT